MTIKKILYIIFGCIGVGLGAVGAVLPLLPAFPCKARVESRLNELDGVSAKVNLKRKIAVVSMEIEVEDEEIRKAIENAGYEVVEIR